MNENEKDRDEMIFEVIEEEYTVEDTILSACPPSTRCTNNTKRK